MHRPAFYKIYNKIETSVGEEEFKSEIYIEKLCAAEYTNQLSIIYNNSRFKNDDNTSGEMKLEITLHYLGVG